MTVTIDKFEYATDGAAQAAWVSSGGDSFSQAFTGGGALDTNYNIRMVIPAGSISESASRIRLFLAGYSTNGTVAGCSIGERNGTSDGFVTGPTRITFSGNNGCTIPSAGIYSDWVDFSLDKTKDYLVHIFYSGAPRGLAQIALSGTRRYYKATVSDETMTVTVSGYTGDSNFDSVGKIQIEPLGVYSEPTIKQSGDYSSKIVAAQTVSLNQAITRTISPTINLTDQDNIKIWVRASRTGTNFKIGLHDSGGTTTESNIAISSANTWEQKTIDISAVSNANKDAIDSIILTITNADAENTIYLDEMLGYADGEGGGVSKSRIIGGV